MQIKLFRLRELNNATIGMLFIDGVYFCDTLEDKIRPVKIMHETCINAGTYELIINYSERFKKPMPLIVNVPNFSGIRIHSGNSIANTSGCILLGVASNSDYLTNSKANFNIFFARLSERLNKEKCIIEIIDNILI